MKLKLLWIHSHFIRGFWGLGFGIERTRAIAGSTTYDTVSFKVFLGPFVINGSLALRKAKRQFESKGDPR